MNLRKPGSELIPVIRRDDAESGTDQAGDCQSGRVVALRLKAGVADRLHVAGKAQMVAGLSFEWDYLAEDQVFEQADVGRVHLLL